jgi:hypothetical protein
MAKPTSRQELIDYCKRSLGAPVIEINVADEQVDDRVDEALEFYQEYHSDAIIQHFRKHQVTQTDIDNRYIDIPEDLIYVTRILPIGYSSNRNMFSIDYQMHLNDIYDLRYPGSIINYEMTKQYMSLLDMTFENGLDQKVRFNRHMNKLFIDTDWDADFKVGDYIVVEGYSTVNPAEYVNVYNDIFLKKYLTALIKKQWGINMKKFSGMQLPGGVEMNGQQIYDEATEEIQRYEEEMLDKYSFPPMGAIG